MKNPIINAELENSLKHLKSLTDSTNQMELSVCIAGFFDQKDLIEICEEALQLNVRLNKRDINKEEVSLYKFVNSRGEEFEIKDILLLNDFPPMRFIEVIFRISSDMDYTRLKYRYYPDVYSALNKILADAYNYKMYCGLSMDMDMCCVTKKLLYINFANEVSELLGDNYKILIDFKYIVHLLIDHKLFENNSRFLKVYNINDNIHIELLSVTNHILKLSIYNKYNNVYIYLDRHIKGIGQLELILELILKHRIYP